MVSSYRQTLIGIKIKSYILENEGNGCSPLNNEEGLRYIISCFSMIYLTEENAVPFLPVSKLPI